MKRTILFAFTWANYICFVACIAVYTFTQEGVYSLVGIACLIVGFISAIVHHCTKPKQQLATFETWAQCTNWFANTLHHDDEPYVAYADLPTEEDKEAFVRQCGTL